MEASATRALSCREGHGQPPYKSTRRSTSTATSDSDRGWTRCRGHSAAAEDVWSTDASRFVSNGEKSSDFSRSKSAETSSRCRGCGGSESMETLDVRLLSPDSGAIVLSENELSTTDNTTPHWTNKVGAHNLT